MTDKEFRKLRKRIRAIASPWITALGLRWWKIDLIWSRDGTDITAKPQDGAGAAHWECMAQCSVKWPYMQAAITFNMPGLSDASDESIEDFVLHELCHILVNEMREWHGDNDPVMHEERVVCSLAKAFRWTRQAARDEGKKAKADAHGTP